MDAAAELQSLRFSPRSSAWKHMQKFERLLANAYPHATDAGKWSVPQIPRFAVGLLPGRWEGGDRARGMQCRGGGIGKKERAGGGEGETEEEKEEAESRARSKRSEEHTSELQSPA